MFVTRPYRMFTSLVSFWGVSYLFENLREEHRLRVFENRVLRRIFGGQQESGENYIMRSLMICAAHPVLCG